MTRFRLNGGRPLFDLTSYARKGPGQRLSLSAAQISRVRGTVTRAAEVMVKVTDGKGSGTSGAVRAHFDYVSRKNKLEIETDDGQRLLGKEAAERLINDWDLDLEADRTQRGLFAFHRRKPPKLVRKITFSMPAGTPPEKVLAAVRDFARDEFGCKHRYAMVLHTDKPHPHVHVTVKAVSEDGVRLDIRRATLRLWRENFARQLRAQGLEANATERRIRGQSRAPKLDSIFRAARRGASSHMAARVQEVVRELKAGALDQSGAPKLQQTRVEILRQWGAIRDLLVTQGEHQLADQVSKFVRQMPPPRTEKQWLAAELVERARSPRRRDVSIVR